MRQIGFEGGVRYNSNETVMHHAPIRDIIKKYLPHLRVSDITDFKSMYVTSWIDHGLLLMLGKTNSNVGHLWIASGYDFLKIHVYDATWDYTNKKWIEHQNFDKIRSMTYMNWGWDGLDDGFYLDNVFETRYGTYSKNSYIGIRWE